MDTTEKGATHVPVGSWVAPLNMSVIERWLYFFIGRMLKQK